jgi:hypothetical protein
MQDQWEAAYPGIVGKMAKYLTLAGGRDPEQGSYSALYAALSKEVVDNKWNGVYLSDPVSICHVPSYLSSWNYKYHGEQAYLLTCIGYSRQGDCTGSRSQSRYCAVGAQ